MGTRSGDTYTETVDDLYFTTAQNMGRDFWDQNFDRRPLWAWLRGKGRIKYQQGGRAIIEKVSKAKNPNVIAFATL